MTKTPICAIIYVVNISLKTTRYAFILGGVFIKRKKCLRYILLIIFVLIAVAGSIFAIYHKNNIQGLLYAGKYNENELAEKNQEIDDQLKAILDEMPDVDIQLLTDEEREKLGSGEVSREEALAIITGKKNQATEDKANSTEINNSKINDIIAECYLLKAEFLNRIDSLIGQARSEWRATPKENRTQSTKLAMADKYMSKGAQLEAECDRRMNSLLKNLETELKASGQSTSIISKITSLYNEEKAVKKASLVAKYASK